MKKINTFRTWLLLSFSLSIIPLYANAELISEGEKTYDANCAACHQKKGIGQVGLAPSIGNRDFLAIASDDFIKSVIAQGRAGTAMVARPDLSGQKVDAIIAFLRSLPISNPKVIKVDNSLKFTGDIKKGADHYLKFCSSCHGTEGQGYSYGGPGPGIGLPSFLNQASDDFIFQTLKHGRSGTAMLSFIGATGLANLSEQDAKDIIVFLRNIDKTTTTKTSAPTGASQYSLCVSCHGQNAEGNIALKAPALQHLSEDYIVKSLKKFKLGARGYDPKDINGATMKSMAGMIADDKTMVMVAKHIKSLAVKTPAATIKGDATSGAALYAMCVACHGANGEGNPLLKAPALAGQADWYIVAQLKNYKAGLRGVHAGDPEGALMRPMSMILANDQAINDVAAHIQNLSKNKRSK
ncbi:c-type cytochrome [Lentisphaera profundi]|uniref:C-type cytochrome n=1 Tax=Lentisphaera profundi TaxID=1658616 RepID=A0ABY7VRC4_9BACT|nr:c-type cytochrome [Lentisphaera profundi]WDE96247.1 c-type cytochrome [Lentisphaera profundi]